MMRSSILFSGLVSFLLVGCVKPYTIGGLFIRNESGQMLYVETNIESSLTSEFQSFMLEEGDYRVIAQSPRYANEIRETLPLDSYIGNNDAYVRVYRLSGDSGEIELVRTWKYKERNQSGRELFNETNLECQKGGNPDGQQYIWYIFTIAPEDVSNVSDFN